jgi:glycosyltransferase involved in cell wall biosynthesis
VRVLLVNQFYPPDMAPTGQHLHDLARALVARGHEVTVTCSRRSYDGGGSYPAEETLDGVAVRRLKAFGFGRQGKTRAADYLSFHARLLTAGWIRKGRWDVALSLTTPPYVGWTVGRAVGKDTAQACWVMDLYPNALAAHGSVSTAARRYRALQALTRRQLARTRLVLALGSHMADRLRPYVTQQTRLDWVPLWGSVDATQATPESIEAVRARRGWRNEDVVFLYSGNMGLGHRLQEFLEAATTTGANVTWAFAGGGQRRPEVEAFKATHPSARIQLLPYVPREELAQSLAAADVHLVSLRRPWQGLVVPSKLPAAFSMSRSVIFVGPGDSEPADWIREANGGWAVEEGDSDALRKAVQEATDPGTRQKRGEAAQAFARDHFDRERNVGRITELLERCCRDR